MAYLSEISSVDQETEQSNEHIVSVPRFVPASKWNEHFDWPPQGGLRHIIFHAPTNGFAPAIKRVGRTVLIDAPRFWQIVEDSQ